MRATELLLQERVPWEAPMIDVTAETAREWAAHVILGVELSYP